MGCSCQQNSKNSGYTVRKGDGTIVTYSTQTEAEAAALRYGGVVLGK
jgi:hypothetical protein